MFAPKVIHVIEDLTASKDFAQKHLSKSAHLPDSLWGRINMQNTWFIRLISARREKSESNTFCHMPEGLYI